MSRCEQLNIDPQSLLPKLPKARDLRPFPTRLALTFLGHSDRVRCISVSPDGQWMVSGSDDGSVRVWEVDTGRCARVWRVGAVVEVRQSVLCLSVCCLSSELNVALSSL
jgi:ribosome biogenesis protein ERB1